MSTVFVGKPANFAHISATMRGADLARKPQAPRRNEDITISHNLLTNVADELFMLHRRAGTCRSSYFRAVDIALEYLSKSSCTHLLVKKAMMAALLIASKVDDVRNVTLDDIVIHEGHLDGPEVSDASDVAETELLVLECLHFDVGRPTPYQHMHAITGSVGASDDFKRTCEVYLICATESASEYISHPNFVIACAAIRAALLVSTPEVELFALLAEKLPDDAATTRLAKHLLLMHAMMKDDSYNPLRSPTLNGVAAGLRPMEAAGMVTGSFSEPQAPFVCTSIPPPAPRDVYVDYEFDEQLGSGSYGVVKRAVSRGQPDAARVAIKEIKQASDVDVREEEGFPDDVVREVATLMVLQRPTHAGIVRVLDVYASPVSAHVVYELCGVDLRAYMSSRSSKGLFKFSGAQVCSLMRQIVGAMSYMHAHGFLHGDIKTRNILFDEETGVVKVADFGGTHPNIPEVEVAYRSTLWYVAPEVALSSRTASFPIDVWAAGTVMAELMSGACPFQKSTSKFSLLVEIFNLLGTPTEETWPGVQKLGWPDDPATGARIFPVWKRDREFVRTTLGVADDAAFDLLMTMLQANPDARTTFDEAGSHPFLAASVGSAPPAPPFQNLEAIATQMTTRARAKRVKKKLRSLY